MAAAALLVTALLLAFAPAALLARRFLARDWLEAAALGAALAPLGWYAAALALTPFGGCTPTAMGAALVAGNLGVLVWAWRARLPRPTLGRPTLALAAVAAAGGLVRLWPQGFAPAWPLGWDSTFHLALVRGIELTGRVPFTWQPFDDAPLNYPQGSHVMVFVLSALTPGEAHLAFNYAITLGVPVATALALAWWARAAARAAPEWAETHFGDYGPAAAAAAWLFLGHFGSLDYARWGGLPSALAMVGTVAFLARLTFPGTRRGETWVLAGLIAAITVVHHHTMLSTGLFLGLLCGLRALAERRLSGEIRRGLAAGLLGLALAAPVTLPLLARSGAAGASEILRFQEHFDWMRVPQEYPGLGMALAAMLGLAPFLRGRAAGQAVAVVYGATMAVAFTLAYFGWRLASYALWGQSFVAMTPSRFLTNLVYPLALPGGLGLMLAWRAGARLSRGVPVALALVIGAVPLLTLHGQYRAPLNAGQAEAYTWLREHAPRDAWVVASGANDVWAPYITAREVHDTPRPISEIQTPYTACKRDLARRLLAGELVFAARPEPSDPCAGLWARPVFVAAQRDLHGHQFVLVHRVHQHRLYEVRK